MAMLQCGRLALSTVRVRCPLTKLWSSRATRCAVHPVATWQRHDFGSAVQRSLSTRQRENQTFVVPSINDPVAIIPQWADCIWWEDSERVELVKECRVEKKYFFQLIDIYNQYNALDFDRNKKEWYIRLDDLPDFFGAGKVVELREKLRRLNFDLGRFPFFETEDEVSRAVEGIHFRFKTDVVAIVLSGKDFLIICPARNKDIEDVITQQLTGVIEHTTSAAVPLHYNQHVETTEAYRTLDVWLVAELLERLEGHLEVSLVVCPDTQLSLDRRHHYKSSLQEPIPRLKTLMPPGFTLFPHQNEGVRFLQNNNGLGILADEMGLGKTATTLAYLALEGKRAVVVCPKNVREVWEDDAVKKFPTFFEGRTVRLGVDRKERNHETEDRLSRARLAIVNYEAFDKFLSAILNAKFHCLVLDESHLVKNPKTKRTKVVLECKDGFEHRILLSGTPLKKGVYDMLTQLHIVTGDGMDEIPDRCPGALWNWMKERGVYLKRTIAEEMPHLPFDEPQLVFVKMEAKGDPFEEVAEVNILKIVLKRLLESALGKVTDTCEQAIKLLREEPGSKAIIFTERKVCLRKIFSYLEELEPGIASAHDGDLGTSERDRTIDDFRDPNSPKRILVSTRHSLAAGVNLQCANIVLFNDLPWSPAEIAQAAGRVKRLNQRKQVQVLWMVATDTGGNYCFDENLMYILQRKFELQLQYAEGKNVLSEQDQKWMNKGVSMHEIAGIQKPIKKRQKR
ncbi:regulator of chromatin subfamily A-like protein 1 [Seminavis robusta]|uniref:Regulator of chromatin subfamily A-like protein 1 n=1 Tax=Seminavis robusta TaxID=568900 RepID=A0A9N8D8J4_9STRA|nr:regulator of chromatin subfamily A-like protein 1 [Seminavis robusta]|eukprot:Sro31_g020250.1 regulator of chromatin subfamily A-like protein 1 (737) ;mRNA; r:72847-75057